MFMRYPNGTIVEGVVLAQGRNRMRVAAAGFPDALELRRSGAQWVTASGEPVEFDFLMSYASQSQGAMSAMPHCLVSAAGEATVQFGG
jgi:hypothetical protein